MAIATLSRIFLYFCEMNTKTVFYFFQLMSPSTAFNIPESEKHTAQRLTSVLDAKVSDSR